MISRFQREKTLQVILPRKSSYSVDTRYFHLKQFSTGEAKCDTDTAIHSTLLIKGT